MAGMAGNMALKALKLPEGKHGKTTDTTLPFFSFKGDNL